MFSMLRPVTATFRPHLAAASSTCWTRWTLEAKVVTMMRSSQFWNWRMKVAPTVFSEGVKPGRSTLVESAHRHRTPSLPSSPRRARSITSPSMGVESILKSPVWTMVPILVWMAKATESAMEWFTWMNSTVNLPARTLLPASTVTSLVDFTSWCSSSFSLMWPAV